MEVSDDGERFYVRVFLAMTERMLAVTRRQLTLCSRQLLRSFFFFFVVVLISTLSSVDAASTVTTVAAGQFHLVAVLPAINFSDWTEAFQDAVSMAATQEGSAVRAPGVALSAAGGVRTVIGDVCAAVERRNVSAMIVVGDQNVINTVLVVARQLGVPLLGYKYADRRSSISPVGPFAADFKPISQLRFDYDTTTTRIRRKIDMLTFCLRRIASNGCRRARYVVVGS